MLLLCAFIECNGDSLTYPRLSMYLAQLFPTNHVHVYCLIKVVMDHVPYGRMTAYFPSASSNTLFLIINA